MGRKLYQATSLTGGASGALDAIDGSLLNDQDFAIVTYDGRSYIYELDHDNSSAEASPWIICPDKNYGTKRWVWQPSDFGNSAIASAYLASDQTGIVHNTATKVNLTEIYDVGSNLASDKWTAPITGKYHFDWACKGYDAAAALTLFIASLYVDGSLVREGNWAYSSGAAYLKSNGSSDLYLTTGQYAELWGYGLTSDTNTFDFKSGASGNWFNVHLISKG